MLLKNYHIYQDIFLIKKMCYKAISENGGTLKSFSDCYNNQEIC